MNGKKFRWCWRQESRYLNFLSWSYGTRHFSGVHSWYYLVSMLTTRMSSMHSVPFSHSSWLVCPPSARSSLLSLYISWVLQSWLVLHSWYSRCDLVLWEGHHTRELELWPCIPGLQPRHVSHSVGLWLSCPSSTLGRGWMRNPPCIRRNGVVGLVVYWYHVRFKVRVRVRVSLHTHGGCMQEPPLFPGCDLQPIIS